jgi:hypothetical protein
MQLHNWNTDHTGAPEPVTPLNAIASCPCDGRAGSVGKPLAEKILERLSDCGFIVTERTKP